MINCEQCVNKGICKFIRDANTLKENILKLSVPAFSPIKIDISCNMFNDSRAGSCKSYGINSLSQHGESPATYLKG